MSANDNLVLALPKGRILKEVTPLVRKAGIEPEPAFDDPASRQLKFATNVAGLEINHWLEQFREATHDLAA